MIFSRVVNLFIFCTNLSSFPASPGITQTDAASLEHHHPCPACLERVLRISGGCVASAWGSPELYWPLLQTGLPAPWFPMRH